MTNASHPVAHHDAPQSRRVRLFRNGRSQAVRIPKEFELAGDEVTIRRDGERLVIEPVRSSMTELLARLRALGDSSEPWPNVDDGLLPVEPPPDFGHGSDS